MIVLAILVAIILGSSYLMLIIGIFKGEEGAGGSLVGLNVLIGFICCFMGPLGVGIFALNAGFSLGLYVVISVIREIYTSLTTPSEKKVTVKYSKTEAALKNRGLWNR